MGLKLTTNNLRKLVLQEIKKLTELGGFGEEEPEEEEEYGEAGEEVAQKPGFQEADPGYEEEVPPEELTGLLSWAKSQGFYPEQW